MPQMLIVEYVMDFEVAIWATKGNKGWTFNKPNDKPYIKPVYILELFFEVKRIHPTQKHLEVIEEIIKVHTNPRDLILDPFSGSGTTVLACKNTGRDAIGVEIDENYFNKSVERLNDTNITFELRRE